MREAYRDKLPKLLLENWQKYGFSAFSKGLFWLTDPEEYRGLMDDYLKGTVLEGKPHLHVIARSAFGKLYVWEEHHGLSLELDFLRHQIYYTPKEILNPSMEIETMKETLKMIEKQSDVYDENHQPLFPQAVEKFGILQDDEMYGFVHPLHLGGENRIENMKKMNLFIHADIQKNMEIPPVVVV